jgi:hypothetical protein
MASSTGRDGGDLDRVEAGRAAVGVVSGTFGFGSDGVTVTSDSTLRFRGRDELEESLGRAGFFVDDVREAPDWPGRGARVRGAEGAMSGTR